MTEIIKKIKSKFLKIETHPETDKLADALKNLNSNNDFQLFRWWIKSLYIDAAHDIVNAPADAVEIIRGRMSAYDQIFQLTSPSGIDVIRKEPEMQKKIADMFYGEIMTGTFDENIAEDTFTI